MDTPELQVAGPVATITLRRPDQANRLTPDDLAALAEQIEAVNARPEVLVLQLRGLGRYFCSGYDIGQLGTGRKVNFEAVVNALEACRPVTIAALHGSVYGGGTDLALACDFRLGARGIDMFMPAARLGLHFYQGGLERYVSRLGLDNAKRLFVTGDKIDAEEMRAIGFLTQLVAQDELTAAVDRLTRTCAGMAPIAMLGMKKHLNRIARGRLDVQALHDDMARAADSADLREGQAAWLAKRIPEFRGV